MYYNQDVECVWYTCTCTYMPPIDARQTALVPRQRRRRLLTGDICGWPGAGPSPGRIIVYMLSPELLES